MIEERKKSANGLKKRRQEERPVASSSTKLSKASEIESKSKTLDCDSVNIIKEEFIQNNNLQ